MTHRLERREAQLAAIEAALMENPPDILESDERWTTALGAIQKIRKRITQLEETMLILQREVGERIIDGRVHAAMQVLEDWRALGPGRSFRIEMSSVLTLEDQEGTFKRFGADTDLEAIQLAAGELLKIAPGLTKGITRATQQYPTKRQLEAVRLLTAAWRATADECRKNAFAADSDLSAQSKAIFAGRSDGYSNAADTLGVILDLIEGGVSSDKLRIEYTRTAETMENHAAPKP